MGTTGTDTATEADDRILLYADYVCPFCYLGRRSLEQYREGRDEPLSLEWHPFDLRADERTSDGSIDGDAADGRDDDYFEQAAENVRRLQERYDVEMAQEIALDVDSLNAQLASSYVAEARPDRWEAFDEAIYDALWTDGRDIGDVDVLAALADDVGVPGDEVRDAVADDDRLADLEERFDAARRRGVTGVPTFVSDGQAARGAVPPEQLRRLVEGA